MDIKTETLEQGIKRHEFFIKGFIVKGSEGLYRVALGELKESKHRKTLRPGWLSPDWNTQTGSVGFMDVMRQKRYTPSDTADPTNLLKMTLQDVLTIMVIGIEPSYLHQGWGKHLLGYAEKIAQQWNLNAVVGDYILYPGTEVRSMLNHAGYVFFGGREQLNGYKKLG